MEIVHSLASTPLVQKVFGSARSPGGFHGVQGRLLTQDEAARGDAASGCLSRLSRLGDGGERWARRFLPQRPQRCPPSSSVPEKRFRREILLTTSHSSLSPPVDAPTAPSARLMPSFDTSWLQGRGNYPVISGQADEVSLSRCRVWTQTSRCQGTASPSRES